MNGRAKFYERCWSGLTTIDPETAEPFLGALADVDLVPREAHHHGGQMSRRESLGLTWVNNRANGVITPVDER